MAHGHDRVGALFAAAGEDASVRRLEQVLVGLLGACLVGLVATGIHLWSTYRPSGLGPGGIQQTHRALSTASLYLAVALAVAAATARSRSPRARVATTALALAGLAWLVGSAFTGHLLRWDQLALWAVTVGTEFRGFTAIYNEQVRFVLVGGVEVATSTFRRWAIIHVLVLPSALVFTLAAIWSFRRSRGRRVQPVGPPKAG